MRLIKIVNIFLALALLALISSLINFPNREASFSPADFQCYFFNSNQTNEIPMDRCCYEIQRQLVCKIINEGVFDFKCLISEESERYFLVNRNTLDYCRREGYYVKAE